MPNYNIADIASDAPATYEAYPELELKGDQGADDVPDDKQDQFIGAAWGNFIDAAIKQSNEVFTGRRSFGSGDVRLLTADTTGERDGFGTGNSGVRVGDFCFVKSSGLFRCTVAGASSSTWVSVGGSSLGYYEPMAAPSSANARDLEFNDAADLSTLATWNPGSLAGFSATLGNSRLILKTTPQNNPTYRYAGVVRDCPTGADWCAWTRVSVSGAPSSAAGLAYGGGLILATNDILPANTPATADFIVIGIAPQSGATDTVAYVQSWSSYTTVSTLHVTSNIGRQSHVWMRVRWTNSSTTLAVDMSSDGVGWVRIFSTASPFVTPSRIGFGIVAYMSASDPSPVLTADFLRFGTSAAYDADTPGRVV